MDILRVIEATVIGSHRLALKFSDGTRGEADLSSQLSGPIFQPLRDPAYFSEMAFDSRCGTVTWPNGADFAPEALRELVTSDVFVAGSTDRQS